VLLLDNTDLAAPFNYLHGTQRQCDALRAAIHMVQKGGVFLLRLGSLELHGSEFRLFDVPIRFLRMYQCML
jgi:hypothetical protein